MYTGYYSEVLFRMKGRGNAIPFTIDPAAAGSAVQLHPRPRVPGSLEAMGFALEGYWEQKQNPGLANYLEVRFEIGPASPFRGIPRKVTCSEGAREAQQAAIDCVGLDEVCRAADGSVYKVPRLKIKLKAKQAPLAVR